MRKTVLVIALGMMIMAAAPPKDAGKADKPAAKAACDYTIQLANEAAGHASPSGPGAAARERPGLIRAVDKRLGGCPVLVLANGRMVAPPAVSSGPATILPAQ